MAKRQLNSTCRKHKETAIKNFAIAGACLIPVIIGLIIMIKSVPEKQFMVYAIVAIMALPVIHFFVEGMKGVFGYNTYTKYYTPYEETNEIHPQGKKKLPRRMRQRIKQIEKINQQQMSTNVPMGEIQHKGE